MKVYQQRTRQRILIGGVLMLLIALVAAISLRTGAYPLSAGDVFDSFTGRASKAVLHVFWNIRAPQVAGAILAGICLGLSGTAMQNVLRNPLASPFTLGISQGAVFGASFAIIVLGAGQMGTNGLGPATGISSFLIVGSAFAGALLTIMVLVAVAALRDLSPSALILVGVALNAFFGSATMLLQFLSSDVQVASTVFWTFGDLRKAGWQELAVMAGAIMPAALFFLWRSWHFNAMVWGEDTAKSLGIRVRRFRLLTLVLAALAASVTTALLGIIGFVGLVAPHCVRLLLGDDHRFLFPYAALTAGLLLLLADLLARTLLAPVVLPVGIVTSLAGAPFFLFLLLSGERVRS